MLAAAWRARRDNMPLQRDMKNSCCVDETLKVFLFLGKELQLRSHMHHLESCSCYTAIHWSTTRNPGYPQIPISCSNPAIGSTHNDTHFWVVSHLNALYIIRK